MCTDTNPSIEHIDLLSYLGHPRLFELFDLPPNVWPAHFLHFCYVGCGLDVYVDGKSSRVYLVGAGQSTPGGYTASIQRLDNSLENWLERWLSDEKQSLWGE